MNAGLERAHTIADLRSLARRRVPQAIFDYVDGAADTELGAVRARKAFEDLEFQPSVLRDVSTIDTAGSVLGAPTALPIVLAPTGFTRMMHSAGECAAAEVAARHGIPYTLATMGTSSIEQVAAASGPHGRRWFQLYIWKDRSASRALMERAAAAGYDTLVITVDVPVAGARLRDVRNRMTIPPTASWTRPLDLARYARWRWARRGAEPLTFASLDRWPGTAATLADRMFDDTVSFDDIEALRPHWPGSLLIKGVQGAEDARRLVACRTDGIVISGHGGRQLDRARPPLHSLTRVREAVGDSVELLLDTGITHGADVVAAVALGATSTLIGRAYLYGLMAGGAAGVERAVEILREQIIRTMKLLGATSLDELSPEHVAVFRM
ncbi:alpha-hydroxy-acid oxidizing protein [Nocardia sp. NPDC101769]|uniref:alpha-hydroxy acid oxidase n=1 Tax=Nocardia sp. NPDC101769 TaxID=3364333 RepID=UPI0038075C08